MRASVVIALLAWAVSASAAAPPAPVEPFEAAVRLNPQGKIDQAVFARLKRLGIPPAGVSSDAVFVRRVFLDCLGTLPTADEAKVFLQDRDPGKRRKLVDQLLAREEFADYWAMKWGDALRVKAEFPINLWPNAVQAYYRWIHQCIKQNVPLDRFAREMLTASGSNFRVGQVNFYRAVQSREPRAIGAAVALTFMGARADRWPKERLDQMAVFFSRIEFKGTGEWKEEIVQFNAFKAPTETTLKVVFPDGSTAALPADRDPREVFADWLLAPKNPYFARAMANRTWCWVFGRGVVHEPDDIRPDNPPSNPELLACLERELIASKYDFKQFLRRIFNSKTYQLSCIPRTDDPRAAENFAYYAPRRLEAEVLADALCRISGTNEEYSSLIPEPFTFIPPDQRSIALADGSITSSFLETFGRSPRDTGLASERDNRLTAAQCLHLLNSSHVRFKIERSQRLRDLMRAGRNPMQAIENLYLAILSRYPTPDELKAVGAYAQRSTVKRWEVPIDVAWALINSAEFVYRH